MEKSVLSGELKTNRPLLFVLYLIGGLMVFLLGSNTYRLFPTNKNLVYVWVLTLLLFGLAMFLRRSARFRAYWEIAFSLFIASFANAFNMFLGTWLEKLLPPAVTTAQILAIDKLSQAIPIVLSIILLTLLSGNDLGSIFLKKGNLRQGLQFGFISFGIFTVIFIVIAVLQSGSPSSKGLTASGVSIDTILSAVPWILIFVFTNSFMEELWFRGISLRKLGPFLGAAAAVVLTALIFGISHLGATYVSPIEMFLFPIIVFILGLVNGFVMMKTDSIWGSVLFHAGYDLIVIIPILVSI
jgi:membrane protease YdiL (CAAX protease family)